MEIKQVILADYANVSREGKLNVLGIFSDIYAQNFPAVHPQMQVVISWTATKTEAGRKKTMQVELHNADGKRLLSLGGEVALPEGAPGRALGGNFILPIPPVRFDEPGSYAFIVMINDEERGRASFDVVKLPQAK